MNEQINKYFKFGWIIKVISKDPNSFQVELANLGNGKHMIVVTDLAQLEAEDTYRQAGYGPFIFNGQNLDLEIDTLQNELILRRN